MVLLIEKVRTVTFRFKIAKQKAFSLYKAI